MFVVPVCSLNFSCFYRCFIYDQSCLDDTMVPQCLAPGCLSILFSFFTSHVSVWVVDSASLWQLAGGLSPQLLLLNLWLAHLSCINSLPEHKRTGFSSTAVARSIQRYKWKHVQAQLLRVLSFDYSSNIYPFSTRLYWHYQCTSLLSVSLGIKHPLWKTPLWKRLVEELTCLLLSTPLLPWTFWCCEKINKRTLKPVLRFCLWAL